MKCSLGVLLCKPECSGKSHNAELLLKQKICAAAETYVHTTVGLLAEMVTYYSKAEPMEPMGASFSAIFKVALVC